MTAFYEWGQPIAASDVQSERVLAHIRAAKRQPFIKMLELRQRDNSIGLVLEFDVERPQYPPVPILYNERILVSFGKDDSEQPEVLALRKDFPDTGHQNLRDVGGPQSLCLFEDSFDDVFPYLTPDLFLNRVAKWLQRASVEELHLSDQPLEPLFFSHEKVIVDPRLFDALEDPDKPILVAMITEQPLLLYASPQVPSEFGNIQGPKIYALPIETQPWHARSIRHRPTTA